MKHSQCSAVLWLLLVAGICHTSLAYREIVGLLDNSKDFTREEVNALSGLFEELQLQYDYIVNQIQKHNDKPAEDELEQLYESTVQELQQQFGSLMSEKATTVYDTTLPTAEEILGDMQMDFTTMTLEEINEYMDMKSILEDSLEEAQLTMKELVVRALLVESELLKLNKPKIVMGTLKALGITFGVAARVGRAAYCTYSHIPQLNASLHHLYDGVGCYLLGTSLIVKIQNEIHTTFKIIKTSIINLAGVYKKVAEKKSIMGKIVSLTMNIERIMRSILNPLRQANRVIDEVVHQLPGAALEVNQCGANFIDKIPYMIQAVANTTECILFVDDSKTEYDWMKPENSTQLPEIIPDPQSGEIDGSFEMP